MKKLFNIILLALAVAAFASCGKEPVPSFVPKTINAFVDDDLTKTTLSGLNVLWENGDVITVFDDDLANHPSNALTISEPVQKVTYVVPTLSADSGVWAAVYPKDDNASCDADYVYTTLPAVQTAKTGSFGANSNLSVAGTESSLGALAFKNVGALLSLSFSSSYTSEISSVTLSANESLAGPVVVALSDFSAIINEKISAGSKSVTVSGSFENNGKYYFSVLPGTYTGLTITFLCSDGKTATYSNPNSLTVQRNANVNIGTIAIADTKWVSPNHVTFDLTTLDDRISASDDNIVWAKTDVAVLTSIKGSGTAIGNYYPGSSTPKTSTRFYSGNTFTIAPASGVEIVRLVATAATDNFATTCSSTTWTNANATVSGAKVTIVPVDGTKTITGAPTGTFGLNSIDVYYLGGPVTNYYTVNVDSDVTGGSISSDITSALEGETITLSYTCNTGYAFVSWNVTNASTSEQITVKDNTFTMPAADVNVTATFEVSSVITYDFNSLTSYPSGFPTASGKTAATAQTFVISGNNLGICAPGGYYIINSTTASSRGLFFGKTKASDGSPVEGTAYLEFPAISGKSLKEVSVTTTSGVAGGVKMNIYDASLHAMSSELSTQSATKATFNFILDGSAANTSYRLASGTTGKNLQFDKIVLTYEDYDPTAVKYGIVCTTVTGGTLSASSSKAKAGDEITLTATPSDGYVFNDDWTVIDAENKPVTVSEGKFTMPASNVTVNGSFSKNTYTITKTPSENGTYTIKVNDAEVSSASKGDKVVLEATPADGYKCDGWDVKDSDGTAVTVSNNAFYMPAKAVTISASFSAKPADVVYDHAGTATDPYSVADAIKYVGTLGTATSERDVYVKGIIATISSIDTGSYGNATYTIKDEGGSEVFTVYRGYYKDNVKFTSTDQIAAGDEVVVVGKVCDYNGTKEFTSGNYIYDLKTPYLNAQASKASGISASGETVTFTVDTNIPNWTASTSDETNFPVSDKTDGGFKVVVSANTSTTNTRSATITISAAGVNDVTISLTQAKAGIDTSDGSPVSFTLGSGKDISSNAGATKGNITITATNGTSNDNNWGGTSYARIQAGATVVVTPNNGAKITEVKFTCSSSYERTWSSSVGDDPVTNTTNHTVIWTGSSTSAITLTNTATSQSRIQTIVVTYE